MKKTVSINLGGVLFTVNDDAYEALQNYIQAIEKAFHDSEEREEIMADIESRMAELLRERHKSASAIISIQDVEYIKSVMGNPKDFSDEAADEPLDYNDSSQKGRKRLYRDADNSVIGGVCSGLAHFVGIDPTWMRIIWALAFIFYGFGFLLYIIMWIVVPTAKTRAEKLEMRGKPVNFSTIGRSVEVEAENLKNKFKDFSNSPKTKNFSRNAKNSVYSGGRKFLRIFGKILGIALLIGGSAGLVGVIASLFNADLSLVMIGSGEEFINYSYTDLSNILFSSNAQLYGALTGTLLITCSPLIVLIYAAFALLLYPKRVSGVWGWLIFIMFLGGIGASIYAGTSTAADFAKKASVSVKEELPQSGDTVFLQVLPYSHDKRYEPEVNPLKETSFLFMDDEFLFTDQVSFDLQPSATAKSSITLSKSARGRTFLRAEARAKNTRFDFNADSTTINLYRAVAIPISDKWRTQNCDVLLRLPVGTYVRTTDDTRKYFPELAPGRNNLFIVGKGGVKPFRG